MSSSFKTLGDIGIDDGNSFPQVFGTTVVSVSNGSSSPVASIPTLADWLVNGFWTNQQSVPHHWASNVITYNLGNLNAAEQFLARSALTAWHETANLTFVETSGPAGITFNHNGTMTAVTNGSLSGPNTIASMTVDISADWVTNDGGAMDGKTGIDSYAYQTYLHEIGHALGLGHQGPYNGNATYAANAIFADDTWQYSVMSYFSQNNYSGSSYRYVVTPQMADIYAVQSMYGAAASHAGDTVYGFNSSNPGNDAGNGYSNVYNFASYTQAPALTIYDSGGTDTLDCSGYSNTQTIDLRPGNFSSVGGLTNNIGIAVGTIIEKAIGGTGSDTIYANDSGCTLMGNAGNDILVGGAGADRLVGGTGTDVMTGNGGADIFVFASGDSSPTLGLRDRIADFTSGDHIDISAMGTFRFLGGVLDGNPYALIYNYSAGTNITTVSGDINGDRVVDFSIDLNGNIVLTANDFIGASPAVNHAPVLTVPSTTITATAGQIIQATTLFSATDQDGDALQYFLYDGTTNPNSGHWVVNGAAIAAGTTYTITAAQLAQTSFVAGTISDDIFMQAADNQLISNTGHIVINTAVNHAPVLTVPSTNVSASAGQVIQATSLFNAVDPDGDALQYYLYDGTTNPNSGHWVVNGTAISAGITYTITAAQLAQTSFVAGTVSDDIFMQATDSLLISNTGHITISTAVNHAPVLTVPSTNVSASAGQVIQATSLFNAVDPDGDALQYYLYDGTTNPNSGHWVVNGTAISAGITYTITAAQLAQTSFVAGTVADDIFMQATDSLLISNTGHITITTAVNHAPVLTVPSTSVSASAGQIIQASTLFSAIDADGDPLQYYLYDGTTDPNSGHWAVNGTAISAGITYTITAAQLAQTTFVVGTVADDIFMQATDSKLISNTGHIKVNIGAGQPPLANATLWNDTAGQSFQFTEGTIPAVAHAVQAGDIGQVASILDHFTENHLVESLLATVSSALEHPGAVPDIHDVLSQLKPLIFGTDHSIL